jgi:hypothetical protein
LDNVKAGKSVYQKVATKDSLAKKRAAMLDLKDLTTAESKAVLSADAKAA